VHCMFPSLKRCERIQETRTVAGLRTSNFSKKKIMKLEEPKFLQKFIKRTKTATKQNRFQELKKQRLKLELELELNKDKFKIQRTKQKR